MKWFFSELLLEEKLINTDICTAQNTKYQQKQKVQKKLHDATIKNFKKIEDTTD